MSSDKLLLVKGMGGMGNRMLAATGALVYAKLTGRHLVFDWSDATYSSDGADVFHRFFRSPSCDPAVRIPQTDDVVPRRWRGRLQESVDRVTRRVPGSRYQDDDLERQSLIDLSRVDYPETVVVFWAYTARLHELRPHLDGRLPELAVLSATDIMRKMLREELILRPEIRDRVREFQTTRFRRPTVGVHVRYTDYRVSVHAVLTKVGEIRRREPSLQIFLATDNSEVLRAVQRVYPDLVTTPHRYGTPGVPLHLDPQCPDRTAGGIEALVDLYLLSACDYLVGDTSSTFVRVAALLSTLPTSAVFDVMKRPKRSKRRRRVLYAFWTRTGLFARIPHLVGRLIALTSR